MGENLGSFCKRVMHTVLDQQAESATQARKMLKPTLEVRWAHNPWVSFYQRKKGGDGMFWGYEESKWKRGSSSGYLSIYALILNAIRGRFWIAHWAGFCKHLNILSFLLSLLTWTKNWSDLFIRLPICDPWQPCKDTQSGNIIDHKKKKTFPEKFCRL